MNLLVKFDNENNCYYFGFLTATVKASHCGRFLFFNKYGVKYGNDIDRHFVNKGFEYSAISQILRNLNSIEQNGHKISGNDCSEEFWFIKEIEDPALNEKQKLGKSMKMWSDEVYDYECNPETYVMKDDNTGLYKIGRSMNPKFREQNFTIRATYI